MSGPAKVPRVRLDELLVAQGLCPTRALAKSLILGGKVRLGTAVLDKPGREFPADSALTLLESPRYVGRGGEKLAGFLEKFPRDVTGIHAMDVGASTGGFTDCLLQNGAASVVCVDVGHGQLHAKIRNDPRVTNLEKTNARDLSQARLPRTSFDAIVMDLSFISLRKVLPSVWPFLTPGGWLVALVKPQFEAEKIEADRGRGVIRDPDVRARVVEEVRTFAREHLAGSSEIGVCDSPLQGADGNHEYLLGLIRNG